MPHKVKIKAKNRKPYKDGEKQQKQENMAKRKRSLISWWQQSGGCTNVTNGKSKAIRDKRLEIRTELDFANPQ